MSERPTGGTDAGLWQTPVADDACNRAAGKWNSRGEPKLSAEVLMWPTPMASDGPKCPSASLPRAVQQELKTTHRNKIEGRNWPSPGYSDYKSGTGYDHGDKKQTPQLRHLLGGKLNPTWVEWLMGWPLAWTDLKPLATDRCHSAPPQPGESLQTALSDA